MSQPSVCLFFFFQAEDGIRDRNVTGVQTCALPISESCIEPALLAQFHPLEAALGAMGVAVWPMVELEADDALASAAAIRSEERRVGKECRSRWWPEQ